MNEDMQSMIVNGIWELVDLLENCNAIDCKWVFKTKKDSNGNIKKFKARLVEKGFMQNEGVDFKETFSPISTKDSFRIIMTTSPHAGKEEAIFHTHFQMRDDSFVYILQSQIPTLAR